jgi:hypothetical protein
MTVTAFASGTGNGGAALTVTTEHFLSDINEAGVFVVEVDTNPLVDGDVLEARVYGGILTGGTARVIDDGFRVYYGAQHADDKTKTIGPFANERTDGTTTTSPMRFSLKQTFGTGRSPTWKVVKVA